jgi:pimeloyl-ACP methyl ester carboxylesterase
LDYRWANDEAQVQEWKEQGVVYVYNGRTQQQMPLYYQLYEDFEANKERLSVDKTLAQLNKPHLIVHGTADPAVSSTSADYLEKHGRQAQKVLIEDANHVFGGKHPFDEEELPLHSHILAQKTLELIQQTS